ncbi:hypothetical protein BGW80DRAFT_1348893, partial [Lactifluus volemus]
TPITPSPSLSLTHLSSQQLNQIMPDASDFGDGVNTVVEAATAGTGNAYAHAHAASGSSCGKGVEFLPQAKTHTTFTKTPDYFAEERPYVVHIGKKGVLGALQELNEHLLQVPTDWIGKEVGPGQIGLINHGGLPKLLTKPGRYPGFPFRNWWARSYEGSRGLSDSVINFRGLTVVQVSQNQAAVISDPQNKIFVLKNSGFVAYGITGSYDVLAIVDQTHLPHVIKDNVTGAILGRSLEVRMSTTTAPSSAKDCVAALL